MEIVEGNKMETKTEITLIVKALFKLREEKQDHIKSIKRAIDPICQEKDLLEVLHHDQEEIRLIDGIIEKQMQHFND